jgi:DNA recombination protein RmuC
VGTEALVGLGVLVVLALVLWLLAATRRELGELRRASTPAEAVAGFLQREIEAVRSEGRQSQEALRREIGTLQQTVADELRAVTTEVARQLQEGMKLIQQAQATMGDRLDQTTRVVGEVQGSLGRLGEAARRIEGIGAGLQGLERILTSSKARGGLGETLLEHLLVEMLPREYWSVQHPFRSGDKVDAVIRIAGRLVPVDAKFSLDNFRRFVEETDEDKRRHFRRAFSRDVRARVDEIAQKYIVPDEGTFDFALMYVPAENVYYEIIVRDAEESEAASAATYALAHHVIPVSPNSFYAYLQVIVLGLRGLQIEANAREIQGDLLRVARDLSGVREHLAKLGGHLKNAQHQFAEADRDLDRLGTKLEAIERKGGAAQPELPGTGR